MFKNDAHDWISQYVRKNVLISITIQHLYTVQELTGTGAAYHNGSGSTKIIAALTPSRNSLIKGFPSKNK
jgi:hypothetical protein